MERANEHIDKNEYLFVLADNGWWLKIDNEEKLMDYHQKTGNGRFEGALSMYWRCEGNIDNILNGLSPKKRIEKMAEKDYKYLLAAYQLASKGNGSIIDGFLWLNIEIGTAQLRNIQKYGAVYINPAGGHTFCLEYSLFCRRKELIFPDFKEYDIRIKRYPYGNHYYAYIGDMQVRKGTDIKWNSHDAAYKCALSIIHAQNS